MATKTDNSDKNKALNLVLTQIERNFGKGSIMRLGDATRMRVETILPER
jgi:recombination protein RecA